MVDVFVIHSGKDYNYIKNVVEPYLKGKINEKGEPIEGECNANIVTLPSGNNNNWKREVLKQIKMAQMVIIVVGSDTAEKSKAKTMGWEVQQAMKYNKQLMIFNTDQYEIPEFLYVTDRFSKQNQPVGKQQSLRTIKERIDNFAKGYYDIFSHKYSEMESDEQQEHKGELLDQYKMFQKSSEDLVTRRQNVNSFYISVNSAMVALVGVVMGLVEMPAKIYVMAFMCVVGIILDFSWINILDAYGILNSAKMKVINLMEEQLPIQLYDVEWRVMSDKLNNKKYVSFTDSEKRIPRIFTLIYCAVIFMIALYGLIFLFR